MMVAGARWRVLAGSPGFLTRYWLWRPRFTARGQVRSRRCGIVWAVICDNWSGRASAQSSGGNVRRPGGGTADDPQGVCEGDAVGVDVRGGGGLRDQRADRVVHDQVGGYLLVDQVGQ